MNAVLSKSSAQAMHHVSSYLLSERQSAYRTCISDTESDITQAIDAFLRAEFQAGQFRQIADAIFAADVILESMSEATADTRDFFTDASVLVAAIFRERPRIPDRMPVLSPRPTARDALAHRLVAALGPYGLAQSSASVREIEEILRIYLSFGQWAELAITVGVTRKDISHIQTPKAEQVRLLLGFVADTLKDLSKPIQYLAPIEPEEFHLVSERAA